MDKEQHISVLWRHLMDMNRQIKLAVRNMSMNANVSFSAMSVIFQLEQQQSMKMNDIADYLCFTLGAATSLVDKLEEQQWVERSRCNQDRRIIYVKLSDEGRNRLAAMREQLTEQAKPIFNDLSVEKLAELTEQLKLLEQYLSAYNEKVYNQQ